MPKPMNDLWKYFEKLHKKENTNYCYARCNYCDPHGNRLLEGRIRTLRNHLRSCSVFNKAKTKHQEVMNRDGGGKTDGGTVAVPTGSTITTATSAASTTTKSPVHVSTANRTSLSSSLSSNNNYNNKRLASIVLGSSTSTPAAKKYKSQTVGNFIDGSLSANDVTKFHQRIIEMIADNNLSFGWVDRPSTRRFLETIRPPAVSVLPSRTQLTTTLVQDSAQHFREVMFSKMQDYHSNFNSDYFFLTNGWVDITKKHVLSCNLAILQFQFAHDEAVFISGSSNTASNLIVINDPPDAVVIAQQIENAFVKTQRDYNITFGGILLDDSGLNPKVKQLLAIRYPNLYFGKCYTHVINLLVKDVFQLVFMEGIVDRARSLINTYLSSKETWLARLQTECKTFYEGPIPSLVRVVDMRWNSLQKSLASILQIKSALQSMELNYGGEIDYPEELKVDETFFMEVKQAEQAIRPLIVASYRLQQDNNTLADVVAIFGQIYIGFSQHEVYSAELVQLLEQRHWKLQEQPLLLLAFMLHPKYASTFRVMAKANSQLLSVLSITNFAIFYYKKYISDDYGQLPDQISKWYYNEYKQVEIYKAQEYFRFWNTIKPLMNNLSILATKILSFQVQTTTSCEVLFGNYGNFITKKRNYLSWEKVHYLNQVKQHVTLLDQTESMKDKSQEKKTTASIIVDATECKKSKLTSELSIDTDDDDDDAASNDDDSSCRGTKKGRSKTTKVKKEAVKKEEKPTEQVEGDATNDTYDDDDDNYINTTSLAEDWLQIFEEMQDTSGGNLGDDDGISEQQQRVGDGQENEFQYSIPNDVPTITYSDGSDYRSHHPYSTIDLNNTEYYEQLTETRKIKIKLSSLFTNQIEIPEH